MNIRLYNHCEPNLLSSNAYQVEQISESAAVTIIAALNSGASCIPITLSTKYLDARAQLHCDKWVEETATHMSLYSAAQQPAATPPIAIPVNIPGAVSADIQRQIIQYKSFSGDVSGVIGEAIFSSLLTKYFALKDEDFAHFRADKQTGIYPDFGIFHLSSKLQANLNWDGNSTFGPVVPAEVKTVTSPDASTIKPRLRKAIQQLQNFWTRANGQGASIICIAIRNQAKKSYDVAFIWGR